MDRANYATHFLASLTLLGACATGSDAAIEPTITVTESESVEASEDPFNIAALADLTPGMIMSIRVSPDGIALEQAFMMLTPKTARGAYDGGDQIVATLYSGGAVASRAAVADPAIVIGDSLGEDDVAKSEVVRQTVRTVSLAVPTPRFVDTLEVTISATGETKAFDVSNVMVDFCAAARGEPSCEGAPAEPEQAKR